MEKTVVQKYGGSSLATEAKVLAVAAKILAARKAGYSPVAVVSAQGDETDELLARARSISPRPAARELDALLAVGEQKSSALLAIALTELGGKAISLTGSQGGAKLVGLSALMTTTVPFMAETIAALKKEAPHCQVMVGGAVLTPQ